MELTLRQLKKVYAKGWPYAPAVRQLYWMRVKRSRRLIQYYKAVRREYDRQT